MSRRTLGMSDALYDYLCQVTVPSDPLLAALREETARHVMGRMQISPEQGQFMALLTELTGATRAIEVGTFTGYSALVVAQAMPDEGRLVCCDINREYTNIAERYWAEAGVAHKIDLRIAPAVDTLDALRAEGGDGTYDFAFIDADKASYQAYFDRCLALLRPGGLIAVDNVLWGGSVVDPAKNDEDTAAIRAFNTQLFADDRVTSTLVPIGDGVSLARKR